MDPTPKTSDWEDKMRALCQEDLVAALKQRIQELERALQEARKEGATACAEPRNSKCDESAAAPSENQSARSQDTAA